LPTRLCCIYGFDPAKTLPDWSFFHLYKTIDLDTTYRRLIAQSWLVCRSPVIKKLYRVSGACPYAAR